MRLTTKNAAHEILSHGKLTQCFSQFLSRTEHRHIMRRDRNHIARLGIASLGTPLAQTRLKRTEATKLNRRTGFQRIFQLDQQQINDILHDMLFTFCNFLVN